MNRKQNEKTPAEKNHNYFYKLTNQINGKFYYGIRSTNKEIEEDYYFGSGSAIRNAIRKYGKENFIKEIIADYPTRKEVSDHEKMTVTLELIQLEECYNCKTGGDNGFTRLMSDEERQHRSDVMPKGKNHHAFGKEVPLEIRCRISQTLTGLMVGEKHWTFHQPYPEEGKRKISEFNAGKTYSEEFKIQISENLKGRFIGENHVFYGKHHSDESKKSISKTRKEWDKKAFLHVETNQYFQTRKEVRECFSISQWSVRNWILIGRLKLIDK